MDVDDTKTELVTARAGESIEGAAVRACMAAAARKRAIVLRAFGTIVLVAANDTARDVALRWASKRD